MTTGGGHKDTERNNKMKNCTAGLGCNYQCFGLVRECSYSGYCDFQLPRDSREFKMNKEVKKGIENMDGEIEESEEGIK